MEVASLSVAASDQNCRVETGSGYIYHQTPLLTEVLMALLFEATELDFELEVDNSSFLDETWVIPVSMWHDTGHHTSICSV